MPVWRNGRRDGLKIRSRKGVGVQVPSPAPLLKQVAFKTQMRILKAFFRVVAHIPATIISLRVRQ